jgi:DNA uptake protein ComE-like DNA-binding protein
MILLPHAISAEETKTSVKRGTQILCGVAPKSKDLIDFAKAQSEERESLDFLLKALTPKQNDWIEEIINHGSLEELIQINGIAESRAKIIISARPYREVKELMLNRGFGYATVAAVIVHGSNLTPE